MNPVDSSCTMAAVARAAGVSVATVSRALRGDPRIRPEVRRRVRAAARRIGYRRDPRLGELMGHLRHARRRAFQGNLAWVTSLDLSIEAKRSVHALYWPSARRRAAELGYAIDVFPAAVPADAPDLESVFRARGIQGVVLLNFSLFDVDEWAWAWREFSFVYTGAAQREFRLDYVTANDAVNNLVLMRTLFGRGYRRIGVACLASVEESLRHAVSGAMRRFELLQPGFRAPPPCLFDAMDGAAGRRVAAWVRRHRVDCIVSQVRGMRDLIESAGLRVPGDVGLAFQAVRPTGENSGMWQREDRLAALAVEMVVASVERGRTGIPDVPREVTIGGEWHEGTTCRGPGRGVP